MIKHIVLWKLRSNVRFEDLTEIKIRLENLPNEIYGLLELKFNYSNLDSSTHNICLESLHNSPQDLENYQLDEKHIAIGKLLKEYVTDRVVIDYKV